MSIDKSFKFNPEKKKNRSVYSQYNQSNLVSIPIEQFLHRYIKIYIEQKGS